LNVVLGFIATEESWRLIPVDVNDASVTRVKERVGDVRRSTPFPLLACLLAPRKSVELIAKDYICILGKLSYRREYAPQEQGLPPHISKSDCRDFAQTSS